MSHAITLVSFMSAELSRDKGQMHTLRMACVTSALDAGLRGNLTQWLQAQALAVNAKGQLAKAYRAAFAAVPAPVKHAYTGKLTAADAAAIATKADEAAAVFSAAFVGVYPLTDAEKTDADKAAAKAKKEAKAKKDAEELMTAAGWAPMREVGVSELTDQVVSLIQSGAIGAENLSKLTEACKAAAKAATKAKQAATV